MHSALVLIGVIVFGIVGAIFAASETAVVACSRVKLNQLAKAGNKRATQLLHLQSKMGQLIGSILIANMFVLTFISALATEFATQTFGPMGVLYATAAMSLFITIYVEVAPKMYVYQAPELIGLRLVPLLIFLRSVLYPVTMAVEKIASLTLRVFGFSQLSASGAAANNSGRDELIGAIDMYQGHTVNPTGLHERAMLRGILDLSALTVSEIMIHRKDIFSLDLSLPPETLCEKIAQSPFTRIPVWKNTSDNITGVINTIRFSKGLYGVQGNIHDLHWDMLIQPPWFVTHNTILLDQLQEFRKRRKHQAFVVDENGDLAGMVTLEDILEEVVGEILDEHDVDIPGVRISSNGKYIIKGDVTLRDLNRQYQWNLPCNGPHYTGGVGA